MTLTTRSLFWRHCVSGTPAFWISIYLQESAVVVTITGDAIDHTDRTRIIPADLRDRRIALDELRAILGDALHDHRVSDAQFSRIMQDVRRSYPH